MEQKYHWIIGIVFVLGLILISGCVQKEPGPIVGDCLDICPDGTSVLCGQECPKTEIQDICGDELKYKTDLEVKDEINAQKAFQKYIDYMKANNLKDEHLAVNWEFTKAEYAGYYKDLLHWVITFHYFTEEGDEGNAQTYVNENGEIVQLLGCI